MGLESFTPVGMGINALTSLFKIGMGIKQNSLANKIKPQFDQYVTSPFAKQQLGTAQNLFNGRMAGAGALENNIYGNQASTQSNINRNTTSSAQALGLAAGVQGNTNDAFQNLQIQEAQNKTNMLGNLNQAYGQMIGEGDKVHQSKMEKFNIDTQQQAALRNSAFQNMFGGANDIAGAAATLGQQGQQDNFWKKFMSGGGGNMGGLGSMVGKF